MSIGAVGGSMRRRRRNSFIMLWAGLLLIVGIVWVYGKLSGGSDPNGSGGGTPEPSLAPPVEQQPAAVAEKEEMIGIWVPFMALTTADKTEEAFKQNFDNIVRISREHGVNTLFVHVRPYCDALYRSSYYPWSHILTDTQGQDPGYDPLQYMVETAHENGMQIHAWINPLRVKTAATPAELSADNPYSEMKGEYPYYFMEYEGAVYLNPAYPHVRTLIANGAVEIVKNYDVDGVHFDDYFYPTQEGTVDAEAYERYTQTTEVPVPLQMWREANINALVSEVYEKIKRQNGSVLFGISPSGNIGNNYKIGADVKTWCAIDGYVDYICPQLYYSYDSETLSYTDALSQWLELPQHNNLDMIIGLALYKAGTDVDEGTWLVSSDIIKRQIEQAREVDCAGVILYSSEYLEREETAKEVENAMAVILPNREEE